MLSRCLDRASMPLSGKICLLVFFGIEYILRLAVILTGFNKRKLSVDLDGGAPAAVSTEDCFFTEQQSIHCFFVES